MTRSSTRRQPSTKKRAVATVAERVTFGRANIYDYVANKDEIELVLLTREHDLWAEDLLALAAEAQGASEGQVASVRPTWNEALREDFVLPFLPYLRGVYLYAHHTEKQLRSMEEADVTDPRRSVAELVYSLAMAFHAGIDARMANEVRD